ncbi:MAG: Maf family protein, partial [Pseudomonadota bacterium]|nr:Maf family protein [Pseudomonadota bacterium]
MLAMLSGRTHAVLTQVTFASEGSIRSILSCNEVTFCVLSIQEIERYVARGESLDKAGGYGLQGFAASYVSHLSGSYTGVVGLPLFETACLFREFGLLPI